MSKYGIVVAAYNRVDSLKRLLSSLNNAFYEENVDLIISIDNSGIEEVFEYANKFEWKFGKKNVILAKERMGLKNHILKCGNYINKFKFDAIILLEDDLYVSPGFFNYSKQAIEFYKNDENIAGISLYQHLWNINADRPFQPILSSYDVFFMQYAQSWGQIWTSKQWNSFYRWYKNEEYKSLDCDFVPENILNWPESSWLKYHIQYCISQNKFFVYPYCALSSNFADAGTHYSDRTNKMQIPLLVDSFKKYNFIRFDKSEVIYDAYFENIKLSEKLGLKNDDIVIDLYGMRKKHKKKYLLTMKNENYKIIKKYGLQMRPHEMNIIFNIEGDNIKLYDTTEFDENSSLKNDVSIDIWNYDSRGTILCKQKIIKIISNEIKVKLKSLKKK